MKNSVLVPLDGSKRAEQALEVADSFLKGKENVSLTILRALETPRLSAWLPADYLPISQREMDMVKAYLAQTAAAWEGRGYEVRTVLAQGPGPIQAITKECSEGRAGLVIMTSHGESGWVEFFLGSNTDKVLRSCPTRVLVLKSENPEQPSGPVFQKILIPLDGSERAELAIPQALDLAPGGRAKILLVAVSVKFRGHAFEGDLKTIVEPDFKRLNEYLDKHAEWLSNQGYEVDSVVRRGEPSEEILKLAEEEKTDLILLTSRGHTGLMLWSFGSVAERILRHSDCSVMVLKEQDELV